MREGEVGEIKPICIGKESKRGKGEGREEGDV
jgi:hypothetical protein